jgi:hypothetical protein
MSKLAAFKLSDGGHRMIPSTDCLTLVALEKVTEHTSYHGRYSTTRITEVSILVPQHILQKVPFYKSELESALSTKTPNGIPKIKDAKFPATGKEPFITTLNFLGGTPLPIIGAAGTQDIDTLKSLLPVYDVCKELQTEALEHAVLSHLADYDYPKLDIFVAFAREVYGDTGSKKREVDSSIGKAVKLKLAALLPRSFQEGVAKNITAKDGVLCTELLEVTIKHFSGASNMEIEEIE